MAIERLSGARLTRTKRRGRDAGFTLLEVLVAFVIATLAFAILARAGLDGLQAADLSRRYQEALARARSHLAALGNNLQPSDRQGDEGQGFHWHIRITLLSSTAIASAADGLADANAGHATLFAVSVAESWGGSRRRSVELDTERVTGVAARSSS
jgi:general secretion pathway protein I